MIASIAMILYGVSANQSVPELFAAGILPGILIAVLMAAYIYIYARRKGIREHGSFSWSRVVRTTMAGLPALGTPLIILGGIYGGIVTPTEAAAVAAFYALFVSVTFYRSVNLRQFYTALLGSARSTAAVGVLVAGAVTFNYVIAREGVPHAIADWLGQYEFSRVEFLIVINLLILALGMVLEGGAILLIIIPILIPSVQAMGIDLVHFGVIAVVNAMVGLITPPYGLLLFIVSSITKQPVSKVIREIWPFVLALIAALGIISFVPDFVLWLPRLLGYRG